MSKIIGIDLGTTNSCVAIMEGKNTRVIENEEGMRTTPSMVAYTEDGEILVGMPAKRQGVTNPENTLFAVKRLIGRRFEDPIVRKDMDMVPYKIVRADNGDAWVRVRDENKAPAQVSAEVLKKMKSTAERYLGMPVEKAVITVPAYFNDSQRQATKDAGKIAGLDVVRIINEPTAAALAYGMDKGQNQTIAVYDLGGGTFDVSILEIGDGVFEVKSTNGDTFLGGEDFDKRLIDYMADEFKKEHRIDLQERPSGAAAPEGGGREGQDRALLDDADRDQPAVHYGGRLGPEASDHEDQPRQAGAAGRGPDHEDGRALQEGAAGRGSQGRRHQRGDPGRRHDPHAQGRRDREAVLRQGAAQGRQPRRGRGDRCRDPGRRLGRRGEGRPAARRDPAILGHRDPWRRVHADHRPQHDDPDQEEPGVLDRRRQPVGGDHQVFQGERELAAQNKLLGQFDLMGIPPAPRGMPQIEVTFDIDANGIVNVSAKDKATGKEQQIRIQASGGLSEAEVEKMVREAAEHAEEDKKRKAAIEARNHADSLIYSTEKSLKEYGDKVAASDKAAIEQAVADLRGVLESDDAEVIKAKTDALAQVSMKLGEAMYKAQAEAAGGASGDEQPRPQGGDGVVDAEFEEVDDDRKKSA